MALLTFLIYVTAWLACMAVAYIVGRLNGYTDGFLAACDDRDGEIKS